MANGQSVDEHIRISTNRRAIIGKIVGANPISAIVVHGLVRCSIRT